MENQRQRINYLDTLRVIACFLVILCHAGDYYQVGTDGGFSESWSQLLVLTRPCVPLFILLSGTLLLPLKATTTSFLKRRFSRIVIPFLIWSVLYVVLPIPGKIIFGGPANVFTGHMSTYLYNLMMIPLNFTGSNVHFWFMYSIIGLYLFMPIISPWVREASKKSFQGFLVVWGITLLIPYIQLWFPQIWGVCDWNKFGMLTYFSGYLGYIILGVFLHRYNTLSTAKSCLLGALLFIVGYGMTYKGIWFDIGRLNAQKVAEVDAASWKILETMIGCLTLNVALMTTGVFLFFQKITFSKRVTKVISELSKMSFGLFLVHYILHLWITSTLAPIFNLNPGIEEVLIACIVFAASYGVIKLISFLPKSTYLTGV